MIGAPAYALSDAKRIPFFMLSNLIGGPGMNSRLNLAVREKYGLVYTIDASYTAYIDTGLFNIYFGTEKKQLKRTTDLVLKELKKRIMRKQEVHNLLKPFQTRFSSQDHVVLSGYPEIATTYSWSTACRAA